MSRKSDELITDRLSARWNARSAPSVGATCVATVAVNAGIPSGRHILDAIMGSILNRSGGQYTVAVEVRDASIGGTVLADFDVIADSIAAAAGANAVAFVVNPTVQGLRASPLVVAIVPPNASVVQKVCA